MSSMAGSIRACARVRDDWPAMSVVSNPLQRSRRSRFLEAWPLLTLAALAWIALMLVVAFGADWLAPYHFSALDLRARLLPPVGFGGSWRHALGTDELGRDVLS